MGQGDLKLFIDECLSPRMAERLAALGHDAVHPIHVGRRGERDDTVLRRCIDEDRIIVTENAEDFRALLDREELHPGLIILPCVARERAWELLRRALEYLWERGDPADLMVNHVLEVSEAGVVTLQVMPA